MFAYLKLSLTVLILGKPELGVHRSHVHSTVNVAPFGVAQEHQWGLHAFPYTDVEHFQHFK